MTDTLNRAPRLKDAPPILESRIAYLQLPTQAGQPYLRKSLTELHPVPAAELAKLREQGTCTLVLVTGARKAWSQDDLNQLVAQHDFAMAPDREGAVLEAASPAEPECCYLRISVSTRQS